MSNQHIVAAVDALPGSAPQSSIPDARSRIVRYSAVVFIDSFLCLFSPFLASHLRMGGEVTPEMLSALVVYSPLSSAIAVLIFHGLGIYRRPWRFASLRDIVTIIQGVTIAVVSVSPLLFVVDRLSAIPKSVLAIQWLILIAFMCGARVSRRLLLEASARRRDSLLSTTAEPRAMRNALLAGPCEAVDLFLRNLERAGAPGPQPRLQPLGILAETSRDLGLKIRGVPVVGKLDALESAVDAFAAEGRRPDCLILLGSRPGADPHDSKPADLAERLGLQIVRLAGAAELAATSARVADGSNFSLDALLDRAPAVLDRATMSEVVQGRRILITGAGGSIGQELTRQVALLRPSKIVLLDSSEFNLFSIDLELLERRPDVPRIPVLCSIRERERLMQVFRLHEPQIVFHAAALKHVPLVEENVSAAVLTNIIGTRNVADAARQCGALAVVQISTDKAVKPIGAMGATKRIAELYCQALDNADRNGPAPTRFITVRFGNVLGSSGSLIPLFQRQLRRGGPLTVTHPEIERFFMTIPEAVQLVLHGSATALRDNETRGRILVLDMGQPIKIIDVARRMIRLSGLRPDVDVEIEIIGLRPGEKLYEELFDASELRQPSRSPGVFQAIPSSVPLERLVRALDALEAAARAGDDKAVVREITGLVPTFRSASRQSGFKPVEANAAFPSELQVTHSV